MRASKRLAEVIIASFIWIRNRCWNPVDVSNMIVLVFSLIDLSYKLIASHVGSGEIIVKTFVSSSAGFASYSNSFRHISIFLSIGHAIQLCD